MDAAELSALLTPGGLRLLDELPPIESSDDVARAALFLASDEARYISGENLMVDGGWSAS